MPRMHLRSLERFPFDAVLLPMNFILASHERYRADFDALKAKCDDRGVAVQLIKSTARRPWDGRERSRGPWYQPLEAPEDIAQRRGLRPELRPGVHQHHGRRGPAAPGAAGGRVTGSAPLRHGDGSDGRRPRDEADLRGSGDDPLNWAGQPGSMASNILETIDRLKSELDALRPLPPDVAAQVEQKLRIESTYHSNAIEGNSLTLHETRDLILNGRPAPWKPTRDHLDIQGHDHAFKAIERAVRYEERLTEVFIRNLHRMLLMEPYESAAMTPEGRRTKRLISMGNYKSVPEQRKDLDRRDVLLHATGNR